MFEKLNLYINIKKMTLFQRRNSVSLSTFNQRPYLTLNNVGFGSILKSYDYTVFKNSYTKRYLF